MRINKKYLNTVSTPAIEDYIDKKLEALNKFDFLKNADDDAVVIDIELGKTTNHHIHGDIFRTEINLSFGGEMLRAVSEKEDLYASIDQAKDDLIREVRRGKNKRWSQIRSGGRKIKDFVRGFLGE